MKTKKRVAINGFGRIGRAVYRILSTNENIEVVAINDIANNATMAHLLKYDSVHGRAKSEIVMEEDHIIFGTQKSQLLHEKNVENLPWKSLNVDIVLEATGHFLTQETANLHLISGAKRVVLSAPPKDNSIKTIVLGVNDNILQDVDKIISNASCTTNNAAPMLKVLDDAFGVESAYITTIHSYTSDQRLQDAPHNDLRRARAAAVSIIPTTTGAAKAIGKIFPNLEGKLGGGGIRVPVPDGSLTDITCRLHTSTTVEEINEKFLKASQTNLKGILHYCNEPIVSIDVVGDSHSCIFDSALTSIVGDMIKVVGWYDNEIGYSNRLVELMELLN
jgi:glyceraldehyde 3-phosphate dehydrogenase